MKGDRLISDYFNAKKSYLRKFVENIEIGETLWAWEISERTGISRTKVYQLMYLLEKRGVVERVPFQWPEPPMNFELWGKTRRAKWKKEVTGHRRGFPGCRWRFNGLIITPVNELLRLAQLDMGLAASVEAA